ncbi:MAG: hypothetical protein BMS9Abin26_0109 [Gammaproteobacteria bacterium]|nr:MAG: hypothetical protein BMS9Abin26_0109 [Gammaproteobacteria bacterium]
MNQMKIFDKLFGRSEPSELVFKSCIAAFEYELETNPCRSPSPSDLVMGIVLHSYKRKDGVQYAHVLSNVVSKPLSEAEVLEWLPGVEPHTLPEELMNLTKGIGTIVSNASCVDNVPQLGVGDFVAVQLSMVMPSGTPMGIIIQAAQPILNPEYGWKSR